MALDGLTTRLARHVASIANAPLTHEDTETLRRLLLDNFIVSLWGATRPVVSEIADWSRRFSGSGSSRVLGREWTTDASIAALVHGTAAHSYELDDTHNATASHPGSVIIPVALAIAAESGPPVRQDDLLQAITAGYEAMALVGMASGGMAAVHRGFHPTSLFGAYGGAATAIALRSLRCGDTVRADDIQRAWGHALSQPSGSMQFSMEPTGGEIKRVHAGLGAHNGIRAADFASLPAVSAPLLSVEGKYGLASSFGGPIVDVDLGGGLQIHELSLKPYSCCRLFHSTIDALREVTEDFGLSVDGIEDILVSGPSLIEEQHMTRAESSMTAQYSCPYIVGATLAFGPTRFDAYGEDFLEDPTIRRLADRVRFELDSGMETEYYPEHFATAVQLTLTDGTVRSAQVVDSVGTREKPLTVDQIIAKAEGLADSGLSGVGDRLAERIWTADDVASLAAALIDESRRIALPTLATSDPRR